MKEWKLYVVLCSDNTLYTGVTTDIDRRVYEHNNTRKGAKYTRSRRPVTLIHEESHDSRSSAQKAEYRIKKLKRVKKLEYISACKIDLNRGII